ncbi:MAG: PDZ domain-containing protein [Thermoanaerobaculia bacterium]|nr:PDZ domain-containing protein [Thermoanaerobaculia bacterium]
MSIELYRRRLLFSGFLAVALLAALSASARALDPSSSESAQVAAEEEKSPPGMLGFGFHYHRPPAEEGEAENGFLSVHGVAPGSPAERAGLRPRDLIVALDGEPLQFPDIAGVLDFFYRVKARQELRLTVERGVETMSMVIVAAVMTPEQARRWEENYARVQSCAGGDCGADEQGQ